MTVRTFKTPPRCRKQASSTRNAFLNLCVLSAYFQFVGPFPGTDLQPIFFVLIILALAFFMGDFSVSKNVVAIVIFSASLIILRILLFDGNLDYRYFSIYILSLVSIIFFWSLYASSALGLSPKYIKLVFFVYAAVGFIQLFIPDFMSWAVHRSEAAVFALVETGRGVRSLTGEPAGLGKVFSTLNIIFVLSVLMTDGEKRKKKILSNSLLFLVGTVFLSRSAYAIGIHLSLFLLLLFLLDKKKFLILAIPLLIGFGSTVSILLSMTEEFDGIRAMNLLSSLVTNPEALLNQGAMRRVLNVPISINNLFLFGWAGSGNSTETFQADVWTPLGVLAYEARSRAIGGFVEFLLRFGVFSLPIMFLYLFIFYKVCFIRVVLEDQMVKIGLYFAAAILLLSLQDSSPALPLSWLMVISIYCFRNRLVWH